MSCYYHPNREAVVHCNECGKPLCSECAGAFHPPACYDCVSVHISNVKGEMFKSIAVSVVLMIIGIAVIKNPAGILLAGIPYGWSILNRMTPTMFLWMSWIGWLVYFGIKLLLAYFIGIIALPIKLFGWISELVRVKKLQSTINNRG